MNSEQVFSTATAKIQIAGQDVGLIQNLTIRETFNTRRLKTLWSRQNVGFIPGTEDIEISAAKAFVELESILFLPDFWRNIIGSLVNLTGVSNAGSLPIQIGSAIGSALSNTAAAQAFTQYSSAIGTGSNGNAQSSSSVQDLLVGLNSNATVTQLARVALAGLINGSISLGTIFAVADWDIIVQGPTVGTSTFQNVNTGNIAETAYGPGDTANATVLYDLFRLKDCRLVGRQLAFDVRDVVVMEQVEIYAQDWQESYEKYVAQPTVMSNAVSKLM